MLSLCAHLKPALWLGMLNCMQALVYDTTSGDEVEDLLALLLYAKCHATDPSSVMRCHSI